MSWAAARANLGRVSEEDSNYRIVVRGRLSERFASAFAGMALESNGATTAFVGTVVDQSQLFGLLERVRSLGLELVSVEPVRR
jgi:hypothetical protein